MKNFPTNTLAALGFVTLTIAAGLWSSPKLMAAIKAALVQNVDEPGRNPYAEHKVFTCINLQSCANDFSLVPAGKRLVVTNIAGELETSVTGSGVAVYFTPYPSVGVLAAVYNLPAISQGQGAAGELRIVNQTLMAYVDPGGIPSVSVSLHGGVLVNAPRFTITGYYVTLP